MNNVVPNQADNTPGVYGINFIPLVDVISVPPAVSGILSGSVLLRESAAWKTMNVTVEANGLDIDNNPSNAGAINTTTVSGFVAGDASWLVDTLDQMSDYSEYLVIATDANGDQRLVGSLEHPSVFSYKLSYNGRRGYTITFKCSSDAPPYYYTTPFVDYPDEILADPELLNLDAYLEAYLADFSTQLEDYLLKDGSRTLTGLLKTASGAGLFYESGIKSIALSGSADSSILLLDIKSATKENKIFFSDSGLEGIGTDYYFFASANGVTFGQNGGKRITLTSDLLTDDYTAKLPAKTGVQTFAMLSDLSDLTEYIRIDGTSSATTDYIALGVGTGFYAGSHSVFTFSDAYQVQEISDGGDISTNVNINASSWSATSSDNSVGEIAQINVYATDLTGVGIKTSDHYAYLRTDNLTGDKIFQFPNKTGVQTFAMLSDIPTVAGVYLPLAGGVTMSGNFNLYADASSAMQPVTYQQMNAALVGLWDDRGNYNASGNMFPSSGGSGPSGSIYKGDIWTISVAGTLGGIAVNAGDTLRALIDSPGTTSSNWAIGEGNLGYTPLSNVLTSAYMFVGNSSNVAVGVSITGDWSVDNTGAVTVNSIKNKAIPTLAAGMLKYTGSAWSFDNTAYITLTSLSGSSGVSYNSGTGAITLNLGTANTWTNIQTATAWVTSGTSGAGYMEMIAQGSRPTALNGSVRLYSTSTAGFGYVKRNVANTGNVYREFSFPDQDITATIQAPSAGSVATLASLETANIFTQINTFSVSQKFSSAGFTINDGTSDFTALDSSAANTLRVGQTFNTIVMARSTTFNSNITASASTSNIAYSRITGVSGGTLNIAPPGNNTGDFILGGAFSGGSYISTTSSASSTSHTKIRTLANTGAGNTGNIYLTPGLPSGGGPTGGNIICFNESATMGGGLAIVFIGTATTAPSSNPSGGYFNYAVDLGSNVAPHFRTSAGHIIKLYQVATYTVTNASTSRSLDVSAATLGQLSAVVGTMIADVKSLGFFG